MGKKKRPDLQHEAHTVPRGVPIDQEWLRAKNRELEDRLWSGPYLRDGIAWLNRRDLEKSLVLTPVQFWYHLDHYVFIVKWQEWWRRVGQKTVTIVGDARVYWETGSDRRPITIIDLRGVKTLSEATPRRATRRYQPRSHTVRDSLKSVFFTWKAWEFIWYFLRGEYRAIQEYCREKGLDPIFCVRKNYGFLRLHWPSLSENLKRPPSRLAGERVEEKYGLAADTIRSRFSLSKWPRPGVTFEGLDAKTPDLLQEVFTPSVLEGQDFKKFFASK